MPKQPPIKVSVLGMGMSATVFHIPFINELPDVYTLHSVMERSATESRSLARDRYGAALKVVNTLQEVINDPDVDCVVISTPNSTHYSFAKAAITAGKDVIIEKPLVPTAAEADELIALAAAQTPPVMIAVYQNRRFDGDYLTVKDLIQRKVFGEVSEFETHYDRWRPELKGGGTWKETVGPGQGIAYDLGSHLVDQVLDLFGPPQRISASIYNSRAIGPADFDDAFFATFYYDNVPGSKIPLRAHVRGTPLSLMDPQMRFTIRGTSAAFLKHGIDPQEDQLKEEPPVSVCDKSFGSDSVSLYGVLTTMKGSTMNKETIPTLNGAYIKWYAAVGEAFLSRDASLLPVKPEEASLVIKVLESMYKSSRTGRVVEL